jgi:arylsulfatase A-like enzyme
LNYEKSIKLLILLGIIFFIIFLSIPESLIKKDVNEICKDCNVILITMDAARADHLSCYGYFRNTTPNIDKIASEGVRFTEAITVAPFTQGSIASIMSSKYSITNGVIAYDYALSNSEVTLAEVLKENEYITAAFVSHAPLWPELGTGFEKGFDVYKNNYSSFDITANDTTNLALDWLEKNYNKKFFFWIHYFDPHWTYKPPYPYNKLFYSNYTGNFDIYNSFDWSNESLSRNLINLTQDDINYAIALYDGEIRYTDDNIGVLLSKLNQFNITNKTIIIITADHGENLGEHGSFFNHGIGVMYENVIKVPLIIKSPTIKLKNKIISGQVQNIDIFPTILDILGISDKEELKDEQGISFLPLIKNPLDKGRVYTYGDLENVTHFIRTEKWKYIYDKGTEKLYDIQNDPYELNNLINNSLDINELKYQLFDWVNKNSRQSEIISPSLNEEIKKRMRELGYIK